MLHWEEWPICPDCHLIVIVALTQHDHWVRIDLEPVDAVRWAATGYPRKGRYNGKIAITIGDPPTARYLWNDMQPADHELLTVHHKYVCPAREWQPPSRNKLRSLAIRDKRRAADKGYERGLLSGHPGPCPLCYQTAMLETDHCPRHGQARDDVCHSCNMRIAKADALFWRGDIAEIHLSDLSHVRHCAQCALELDLIEHGSGEPMTLR